MGADEAQHLLGRAAFGATPKELQEWENLSRKQAVDKLLSSSSGKPIVPPPTWAKSDMDFPAFKALSVEDKKEYQKLQRTQNIELSAWWLSEMLNTSSPLTERMTLFWHNHFVSARNKVKAAELLNQQNQLFRQNALGNFATMLHEVARNPAMMIYLDAGSNRKASPNENFAREVMELFTLGVGNYTEQDVKEAARAFTGWTIDRQTGEVNFRPRLHDGGAKTVLGVTGNLDSDAVLDILLSRPETAEFIVRKMWREFVDETPSAAEEKEIQRIAKDFRASGYEIKIALRSILLSDAFYDAANRGNLIKSPVDLVVGTLHILDIEVADPRILVLQLRQLGQDIFNPPNVKGWPGGDDWINTSTLLSRKSFIDRLLRAEDMPDAGNMMNMRTAKMQKNGKFNLHFYADDWFASLPKNDPMAAQKVLLAEEPVIPPTGQPNTLAWIRQLMLDPSYQLK